MEALDDVVVVAEEIACRLELDLGEHLEGFGLRGLMRHLAGLFALVVGIEDGDTGLDLRLQKIEAVVVDRLRRRPDLEIGGNGESRHEDAHEGKELMGDVTFLHECLAKSVGSAIPDR